jgi:hypothetical protein
VVPGSTPADLKHSLQKQKNDFEKFDEKQSCRTTGKFKLRAGHSRAVARNSRVMD